MTARTPLDDIEHIARSRHRVRVLDELETGRRTRRELRETTGISQPTLGRILTGFEDREWVTKRGGTYELTPLGRLLATAFGRLHDTATVVRTLEPVAPFLPFDDLPFDVELLADATITVPDPPDMAAHLRRADELVSGASRIRTVVRNFSLDTVPRQRELVLEGGQTEEIVIAADALAGLLSHPSAVETARELLATDRFAVFRYDGTIPFGVSVVDDRAVIVPYNDQALPCALVDTADETVVAWAAATVDDYRDRAEPVTVDDLPSSGADVSDG